MLRYLERHFSKGWLLVFSVDFLILLSAVIIALKTMDICNTNLPYMQLSYIYLTAFISISLIMLFVNELYSIEKKYQPGSLILKCILSFTIVFIGCYFLFSGKLIWFSCILSAVACGLILCWRFMFYQIIPKINIQHKILFLGTDDLNRMVVREILNDAHPKFKVLGFVDNNSDNGGNPVMDQKVFGIKDDLDSIIKKGKVEKLIVSCSQMRGEFPAESLIKLKLDGIEVLDVHTFYERLKGKILLNGLQPSWLIFAPGFKKTKFIKLEKRAFDIILSSIGLIVTIPISIITALLIKLDSGGPIIYKQERIGENGCTFNLLKFRSMRADAEKDTGPVWAGENDNRVTRVGKFIRKMHLDEIPQMINVLMGDMSFIGPRPERPYFVEMLSKIIPYYNYRHSIKPGITGWAAVNYDYGASIEDAVEKLQYDLYYLKNLSLFLDVLILLKTIAIVFSRRGAR
jgi:sugar transferase (PEP-CTERM system associated)